MANATLRAEFEQAIVDATVSRLVGISADDVQVVLSNGSIKVELIVTPSSPGLVGEVVSSLQVAEDTGDLQTKVLQQIQAIPNIESISTGTLDVAVTASASERQSIASSTTLTSTPYFEPRMGADSSKLSVAGSSVLLVAAIAAWVAFP